MIKNKIVSALWILIALVGIASGQEPVIGMFYDVAATICSGDFPIYSYTTVYVIAVLPETIPAITAAEFKISGLVPNPLVIMAPTWNSPLTIGDPLVDGLAIAFTEPQAGPIVVLGNYQFFPVGAWPDSNSVWSMVESLCGNLAVVDENYITINALGSDFIANCTVNCECDYVDPSDTELDCNISLGIFPECERVPEGSGSGRVVNDCEECTVYARVKRCSESIPFADPVLPFSGEFYEEVEDLRIPGRGMDFVWSRKYRSRVGFDSPQGNSWDYAFNIFFEQDGDNLALCNGNARRDIYYLRSNGLYTARQYFREVTVNPDNTITLLHADTSTWDFFALDGAPHAGKISRMTDRNGNFMSFEYDDSGRLITIVDTLDRDISIAYNTDGYIEAVSDFAGRELRYEYYQDGDAGGSEGDLKSVRSPIIENTPEFPIPPGHDFPAGKTTVYTYSKGLAAEYLNHNLLTITDPKGQTYLVNEYASTTDPNDLYYDRIMRQTWGNPGDIVDFVPVPVTPSGENNGAVIKVIVNERMGNVKEFFYDHRNFLCLQHEYTGRAPDPDAPTTDSSNRPINPLRPGDPEYFETRYEMNADGQHTRIVYPNGNIEENVYELELSGENEDNWRSRGNLRYRYRISGPVAADQDTLVEYFEYQDIGGCCANFDTLTIDPRGNTTITRYDERGNITQIQHTIPSIVEDFTYNEFGQLTGHTHPDNGSSWQREDVYTYYSDPFDPQFGYQKEEIIDVANLALTSSYGYDAVGNVIRITDPRGNDRIMIVNQLNQVIQDSSRIVSDELPIRYVTNTYYDANDNIIRQDVPNIDETGSSPGGNTHVTTLFDYEILNNKIVMAQEKGSVNLAPGVLSPADIPPGDLDEFVFTECEYDENRNRILIRNGEASAGNQPTNTNSSQYDERNLIYREIRAETDSDQSSTQYDYDGNENISAVHSGLEGTPRTTLRTYDGYNRLLFDTDPMGNVSEYHYDPNGNLVREIVSGELLDVAGETLNIRLSETSYFYDELDRQIRNEIEFFESETQTPIGDGKSITEKDFTDNSQVQFGRDDNGNEIAATYDTANRLLTITDAMGNTSTNEYDSNSNVVSVREIEKSDLGNPDELFTTIKHYDGLNRLIRVIDNANQVVQFSYDSRNNQTLKTDPLENIIRYEYDGLDRLLLTEQILTDNGLGSGTAVDTISTRQNWDDSSRLIGQSDDNGNETAYEYDALNRMVSTQFADNTSSSCAFDVHDNEISREDANGNAVTTTYDLLDRPIQRTIVRAAGVLGTSNEAFQYDGLSRIVRATDDDSQVDRKYDSLSNPVWEQIAQVNFKSKARHSSRSRQLLSSEFSYDGLGNLISCTYPGGRQITFSYDALNRKKEISDSAGTIASYSFQGPERVERREYPMSQLEYSVRTDFSYDWGKRITGTRSVRNPSGVSELLDARAYAWDASSNKIERKDIRAGGPKLQYNYIYDSTYRMVHSSVMDAKGTTFREIDYNLDGAGNRTLVTGDDCPGPYTMDPTLPEPADFQVNQYSSTPCDSMEYDRNGNLILIDSALPTQQSISYDYRNQIVRHVDHGSAVISTYSYDPFGRRFAVVVDDGIPLTRFFAYNEWQVIEEQNEFGNTLATFTYGLYIDEVLSMQRGGGDYFYITDDLYNVMAVTDETGVVVERYEYSDYGHPVDPITLTPIVGNPSVIENPYLFTGRRYDPESELYYFRTRYLDPVRGRFMTRDTIGIWGDLASHGNAYTYVGNNPWSHLDADGTSIWSRIWKVKKLVKQIYKTNRKIARFKNALRSVMKKVRTFEKKIDNIEKKIKAVKKELDAAINAACPQKKYLDKLEKFQKDFDKVKKDYDKQMARAERLRRKTNKHEQAVISATTLLAPNAIALSRNPNASILNVVLAGLWDIACTIDPIFLTDAVNELSGLND